MSASAPPPPVGERFDNLLISPLRVHQMLGKRSPGEVAFEESEQSDARRDLLRVEKVAIKNKAEQAKTHASFLDAVSSELHDLIIAEIQKTIQSPSNIYTRVLALNDDVSGLLDTLSARVPSVAKIEPYAAALPWMFDEFIQTANAPAFRRKDARGRVIVVESLKTALSFLGVENLRLLVPWLVLKRTLPQITDPYPQIKQKLRQYATATAVTARELAQFCEVKPYHAYTLGMLSSLGNCALIRLYFRLFDQVHREQLLDAQLRRQRDKHAALLHIKPSANYLIAAQQEYADRLSADLFEHMLFKRLAIAEPMRRFTTTLSVDRGSAADTLKLARCYTRVRMLHQHRCIEKAEAKDALREAQFPAGAIDVLKARNIFELPLKSEPDRNASACAPPAEPKT